MGFDLTGSMASIAWVGERDGALSYVSQGWYAYTGQAPGQALGLGWLDAVHEDDRAPLQACWTSRPPAGQVRCVRFRLRRADGVHREVVARGWPRQDGAGAFLGFAVTLAEADPAAAPEPERVRRMPTLLSERDRLAELFEQSPSFACVLSGPDFVFEVANAQYLELIGRRDVIGKPLREVLPEAAEQGFLGLLEHVYRTGTPYVGAETHVRIRHETGFDERCVDFVYKPLRNADGETTGIFVQGIDITGFKRTEAALRRQTERLQLFVSNVRDYALVITDADGTILEWQGGAERITGHTAAEAVGQPLAMLFTPEDRARGEVERELQRARGEGRADDRRWHLRRDGTRFFASGATVPLTDEAGNLHGFGKVFQDETARQRESERGALLLAVARHILESPAEIGTLFGEVFAMIRGHLDADVACNCQLVDGALMPVHVAGVAEAAMRTATVCGCEATIRADVLTDRATRAADAVRIADDPAFAFARAIGLRAYVCHPLFSREGHLLGTFAIGSRQRERFEPEEQQFVQAVSHLLALAWERQLAERSLAQLTQESERRRRLYETVLSTTPDLVYVLDLEHRFIYANEGLLRLWGRGWDEAIGRTCWELGYEPWHAAMHDRELEQVKATRRPIRGIVPFEGTFGRRIYDYIFVPVIGPDGEVEAIAGTTRDITELKQSQDETAALLAKETLRARQLARVADASRGINALQAPESIARLLAEEARHVIGAHQAVVSLTDGEDWSHAVTAISLSDKYAAWRDFRERPDGSGIYAWVCRERRPLRMTQAELEAHPAWQGFGAHHASHPPLRGWLAVPLIGHGGKVLGLVQLSDKHEGEFTEEDQAILVQLAAIAAAGLENAHLYERLREEDRRKDEFLATLAHELRNPLAPIRSGLTVLEMAPGEEEARQTRAIMKRQVQHMVRLIDDLLDIARITSGKVRLRRETVELALVLDDALEVSRAAITAAGHRLEVSLPAEPVYLDADRTRLAQVIANLLNNAAKYTPEGGRIGFAAEVDGDTVTLRVSDTGVGLTPESLDKVWGLFAQAGKTLDRAQGGLGIGLALVKRLVEMHGGSVAAASDGPGQGATFTVRLPRAAAEAPAAPEPGAGCPPPLPRLRVLVVDDNVDAAEMLGLQLRLRGHEVSTVHSGADALVLATRCPPDVAFLDIGMPGMDGYALARALRAEPATSATLLVAVTGWGGAADRRRALEHGFDHHLTKPATADAVDAVLARAAAGRVALA